jgi:hypothetical protein
MASLYLDATFGAKVHSDFAAARDSKAQEFPFSSKRLPVAKSPGKRLVWNTLKALFFNSLWRA